MMILNTWWSLVQPLLWIGITALAWFLSKLYLVRSRFLALRRQGLVRTRVDEAVATYY